MIVPEPHDADKLIMHADGTLPSSERNAIEQHLRDCRTCRQFLSFVMDFNRGLREARSDTKLPDEPCPDSSLIVSMEADELEEETAQHVRAHILFCPHCREDFFLLTGLQRTEVKEPIALSWQALIETLKEFAIDLGKIYGPGTMLGSVRIAAEEPAFSLRGGDESHRIFKVLEVSVGENTYSVELAITPAGSVSFDTTGLLISRQEPLRVEVHSESGEALFETQTDQHGNTCFVLERERLSENLGVFILTLGESSNHFMFFLPRAPSS